MANPIFTKTGTPTVTLSQAPDLGAANIPRPRQVYQRFWGGGYNVLTRGTEDDVHNLVFSAMLTVDADALLVFFQSEAVNYGEHAFTYTDENSVEHQVRYLQGNLPGIPVGPTARRVSLTLIEDSGVLD